MAYTALLFDVRDHVAHLTLNRPDVYNALDATMARDLLAAVTACEQDPAVRAVLLTGAGKAFCAGGDLRTFAAAHTGAGTAEELRVVLESLHDAIFRLTHLKAPVIAAVNGVAAGAGLSIACACDLVLASDAARFTVAYTRAGLTPDGSSTYFLPRRVGLGRALELALTNRTFDAHEALEWGIANRVVPAADLTAEAESLAAQLARGPTRTLGATKLLLRASWETALQQQLTREAETITTIAATADAREGILAFVEKRPPNFTGH
jgi:2-(1,2-epoxy-1,2-dihydrophenyl)acetyl-CoA isomerase